MARQADYRADDHIVQTDDPYTQPAFSLGNRLRRLFWNVAWLMIYRPTPRPMHAWRSMVLRWFGAKVGADCRFYPSAKIWAPWNLVSADHVAVGPGAEIYNPSVIELETHVILSQDSYLCGATHDYNDVAFPLVAYRMRVGRYAWICAKACVGPGVNVGEGAVLGMAAVTNRDLAPWTVYAGSPAEKVRERNREIAPGPYAV